MTENRPYRPFAANIQEMQRAFFVQAGVCGIRVLQNFVVENSFLGRSDNLGQLSPNSQDQNFSHAETLNLLRLSLTENFPGKPSQ